MALGLPPPPIKEDLPPIFKEWLNKLYRFLGDASGLITWGQINTSGSSLDDITTRPHSMLQGVSGSTEQVHVSTTERANLQELADGTSTILHTHDHGLLGGLTDDDHTQYVLATGTRNITGPQEFEDNIILPKTSGKGIQVDNVTPSFGWRDLIGDVVPKTAGVGSPALTVFRSDIRWFSYNTADDGDIVFHLPHDYLPGSDMFMHVHWGHNGTNISGSIDIRFHLSYAKGHQQANFPLDVEPHLIVSSLNITNTPQYHHRVDEFQISISGGSATQLDTDDIEPDGLVLVHYDIDVIPTITGGTPNRPYIFAIDIHYQSTGIATKNKVPDFYA